MPTAEPPHHENMEPVIELMGGPLDGCNSQDHKEHFKGNEQGWKQTRISIQQDHRIVLNYNFYRVSSVKIDGESRNKYLFIFHNTK